MTAVQTTGARFMDVVVCKQPGELIAEQRPVPVPGEGEILVRVKRVGVCGTDMHIFRGTQPYLSYPRVMGHEISGIVESAPPDSELKVGEQVYVIPYLSCGACHPCRLGKPNCCMRLEVLGVHRDGALASYVSIPERFVASAEGVTLDQAAMIEFLAIGAHAVSRGMVRDNHHVLVSGAGPIGIACALFAKIRGADVTVLDTREDRLKFCSETVGVQQALVADASVDEKLASLTEGNMFDVVIDATGNAKAMQNAFKYIAHGGAYVLVSVVSADLTFSDPEFHKREATLIGSRNATPADFHYVLACMREQKIPTDALHTHGADLLAVPQALAGWLKPETAVIKAVVNC